MSIRATLKNSTLGAVSVCRGSAYRGGDDDAVAQLRGSDTLKERSDAYRKNDESELADQGVQSEFE